MRTIVAPRTRNSRPRSSSDGGQTQTRASRNVRRSARSPSLSPNSALAKFFHNERLRFGNELVHTRDERVGVEELPPPKRALKRHSTTEVLRMPIKSKREFAARANCSVRHLERLISSGLGPPIVRLGVRKIGIEESDGEAWIRSRKVMPPGHSDVSAK
jgi:predicted DNA-binding transcriptional regulator AlpA